MKLTDVTKELEETLANVPPMPIIQSGGSKPHFSDLVNLAADHAKELLTGPSKKYIFINIRTAERILNTRRTDLYLAAIDLKGLGVFNTGCIKDAFLDYSVYDKFKEYGKLDIFFESFKCISKFFFNNRLYDNTIVNTIFDMPDTLLYKHLDWVDMIFNDSAYCKYLINALYVKAVEYNSFNPKGKFGTFVERYKAYYPTDQYATYISLMDAFMNRRDGLLIFTPAFLSNKETIFEEGMYSVSSPLYMYMKGILRDGDISIIHNMYYKYNDIVSGLHFKMDMDILSRLSNITITDFDFDKFEEYGIFVDDCCNKLSSKDIRERLHNYRLHHNWRERLNIYNPQIR